MNNWLLIGTAAAASYLMRSIPLLVFRRLTLSSESPVVRLLQHAASAVMGSSGADGKRMKRAIPRPRGSPSPSRIAPSAK